MDRTSKTSEPRPAADPTTPDAPADAAEKPRRKRNAGGKAGRGRQTKAQDVADAPMADATLAPAPAPATARLVVELGHATTRYWLRPADPRHTPTAGAMPSVVAYDAAAGWRAAEAAVRGRLMAPEGVLSAPMRLLGLPAAARAGSAGRGVLADTVDDGGDAAFSLHGRTVRPELATAALLAEVVRRLEAAAQAIPQDVVLLVPVHADFARRRAYLQAAAIAGLPPPRLAHAPWGAARVAASALAARGRAGTLCLVDLGADGAAVTVLTVAAEAPEAAPDEAEGAATSVETSSEARPADPTLEAPRAAVARRTQHGADVEAAAADDGRTGADAETPTPPPAGGDAPSVEAAPQAPHGDAHADASSPTAAEQGAAVDAAPAANDGKSDAEAAAVVPAPNADADADDADQRASAPPPNAAAAPRGHGVRAPHAGGQETSDAAPPAPLDLPPLRLEVRAHRAASGVGGEALDAALVGWLRDGYLAAHNADPTADLLGHGRLWSAAERARRALDADPEVAVHLPHLTAEARGTRHLTTKLRRDELAALGSDATQKVVALCREACRAAGRELREVDGWAMVGGLAGAHHLTQALRRAFHRAPLQLEAPEFAAVSGAAALAAPVGEPTEACVAALAVTLPGGGEEVLVAAGTALPTTAHFTVATQVDEQDLLRVPLHLGAADGELAWRDVGRLEVDGLPAAPAGKLTVQLELTLAADMQLHARAHTGKKPLAVRHLHVAGLSEEGVARLVAAQAAEAQARARRAQLVALRQDAQALLAQTAALGAGVLGAEAEDLEGVADEGAALAAAEAARCEALREALEGALANVAGDAPAPAEGAEAATAQRDAPSWRAPDEASLAALADHVRALRSAAARADAAGAAASPGA